MNKKDYSTNFESTEEIVSKIEAKVKLFVYNTHHAVYDKHLNKWVHDDPSKMWFNLEDIIYFRPQNENDGYDNNADYVMDSTYMPTEWCMMVYHDEYSKRIKIVPVVGNYKELNKRFEYLKDEYYKHSDRLSKLKDDIKEIYLRREIDTKIF